MTKHAGSSSRKGCLFAARQLGWFRHWLENSTAAPLMFIYCLLLMMNTLLRDTKDTLLVTSDAGVEAIPILKSWAVIPVSILFFVFYHNVSAVLDERKTFIFILGLFNAFYFFFALILYPRQRSFVPSIVAANHVDAPSELSPVQALLENWILGLFYCVTELYSSSVCTLLFWQVANNVVSMHEAKSIYPLIGAMGNLGMVCAGYLLRIFADQRDTIAASAYLRIHSQASKALDAGAGKSAAEKPVASINSPNAAPETFLSYDSGNMRPVDTAWQTTLLGIALMLAGTSFLVLYAYDTVLHRKELLAYHEAIGSGRAQRSFSDADDKVGGGSGVQPPMSPISGAKVKRRTGSGGYQLRPGPVSLSLASATAGSGNNNCPADESSLGSGMEMSALNIDGRTSAADTGSSVQVMTIGGGFENGAPAAGADDAAGSLKGDGSGSHGNGPLMRSGTSSKQKKERVKMSLLEGLKTLSQSTPLRAAAVLVISYGVSISLVEVSWKGQVRRSLATPNDYSRFMATFWQLTGLVSMAFMLVGRCVLQRSGYGPAVLFTPVSMAVMGTLFFVVSIYMDLTSMDGDLTTRTPWAAYFGAAAVLLAKAAKYAFFDATKEIIFIPLDNHSKSLGKAAIDVVGYRLSKSGGSVWLQFVIFMTGSLSTTKGIMPIAALFGVVVISWIHAGFQATRFINNSHQSELATDSDHIV